MSALRHPLVQLLLLTVSMAATWRLLRTLQPLLRRYALARPNARSSHSTPTPQGGGIAVIGVVALVSIGAALLDSTGVGMGRVLLAITAMIGLGVLGAWDDVRPLPVRARLALQFAGAALLVAALPAGMQALPLLPPAVEMLILVVGLVWFINLTNFMDGIDWITVAEMAPIALALAVLAGAGVLPPVVGAIALGLAGALLGFAPYNKPVARLFLGDVGSLAIGGLVGWMLILLAGHGQFAAALILPMYYLGDSGLTLFRRWRRGERLSEAHRSHVYQLALQKGFSVPAIVGRVLALNIALAVLALLAVRVQGLSPSIMALAGAAVLTALMMRDLERGPPA